MMSERSCANCHYGGVDIHLDSPCNRQGGCYYDKAMPGWKPMTNADAIRRKTDTELAGMLLAWQEKHAGIKEIRAWLKQEYK